MEVTTHFKKPKGWRKDERYRLAVKALPCALCGVLGVDAHHWIGNGHGGTALTAPDYETMPACRPCHRKIHDDCKRYDQKKMIMDAREELILLGMIEDKYPIPK